MKTIIVDDEKTNIENLRALLHKHCPHVNIVACASNREEATKLINIHQPDLLFLDIQLGKETGFDILKSLHSIRVEVIFVTAFDQYAIQAIKFAALDYLLKPIDIDELMIAVGKAETKIRSNSANMQLEFFLNQLSKDQSRPLKIALPQQREIRYTTVDGIWRCQADNAYTFFYLVNGEKVLVSKTLKEYAELLEPYGFIRTHQSHLINSNFVKSWLKEDGGVILLDNGDKIPVSKVNRDKVRSILSGRKY